MPGGKRLIVVVILTLGAGAVMADAGYLFHRYGWGTAGPTTIAAGVMISIAFMIATAMAATTPDGQPAAPVPWHRRARRLALMLVVPLGGDGAPVIAQIGSGLLSLVSGAILVFGGWAGANWSWWLLPPLVLASGVTISGAFAATVVPVRRRANGTGN